jgi:hypothetical protein
MSVNEGGEIPTNNWGRKLSAHLVDHRLSDPVRHPRPVIAQENYINQDYPPNIGK